MYSFLKIAGHMGISIEENMYTIYPIADRAGKLQGLCQLPDERTKADALYKSGKVKVVSHHSVRYG